MISGRPTIKKPKCFNLASKFILNNLSSLYFLLTHQIISRTGKLCHLGFPKILSLFLWVFFLLHGMFFIPVFLNHGTTDSSCWIILTCGGRQSFVLYSFLYPNIHLPSSIDNMFLLYLFSNLFQLHFLLSYNLKFISLCVLFAESEL